MALAEEQGSYWGTPHRKYTNRNIIRLNTYKFKQTHIKKIHFIPLPFSSCTLLLLLRAIGTMRLRLLMCNCLLPDKNDSLLSAAKIILRVCYRNINIFLYRRRTKLSVITTKCKLCNTLASYFILPVKMHTQSNYEHNSLFN